MESQKGTLFLIQCFRTKTWESLGERERERMWEFKDKRESERVMAREQVI